jgi:putative protease
LGYNLVKENTQTSAKLKESGKYLLSPADLCLLPYLRGLQEAGITSLKIEGRMKRPEYVATVTRIYREVLEELERDQNYQPPEELTGSLLKIFNRNFSSGYLLTNKNRSFLSTTRPNNRGINVGRIVDQDNNNNARIKLTGDVSQGDGLEIWVSKGRGPAFTVREMRKDGKLAKHAAGGETITVSLDSKVNSGDRVFKTYDAGLFGQALESIRPRFRHHLIVDARVYLNEGNPMKLVLTDRKGRSVTAYTHSKAQPAARHPLTEELVRSKLDRMGNTPFQLGQLELLSEGELMVPFSEINEARRQAVEDLTKIQLQAQMPVAINYQEFQTKKRDFISSGTVKRSQKIPILSVMVSNAEQAYSAFRGGADRVYLGLEGLLTRKRTSRQDLLQLADYAQSHQTQLVPALPRIQTQGQENAFRLIEGTELAVMAGNPGSLHRCLKTGREVIGDYTLNVFNRYSLRFLLEQGVSGVCLSPELNFSQLQLFTDLGQTELLVHGEIILMLSEYCMLWGVMGQEEKCSGICQQDRYYIKDERGYSFPVATDADCRFYVFNSRTLCMMDKIDKIIALGPASIRIEARRLNPPAVEKTVAGYRMALDELGAGLKPDLQLYQEKLMLPGEAFTRSHYYRGVL